LKTRLHKPIHKPRSVLRQFLHGEASGGIVLIAAAALALIVANSPLVDAPRASDKIARFTRGFPDLPTRLVKRASGFVLWMMRCRVP
jgi:hypothetical protein